MKRPETVTRYVVTYVDARVGLRTLANAMQGRFTYATREEAQAVLDALLSANSAERVAEIWGKGSAETFEVRSCECYAGHFDPVGCYFEHEPVRS